MQDELASGAEFGFVFKHSATFSKNFRRRTWRRFSIAWGFGAWPRPPRASPSQKPLTWIT